MAKTKYVKVNGAYGSEYIAYEYPTENGEYWTIQFDNYTIGVSASDVAPLIELLKAVQKKESK